MKLIVIQINFMKQILIAQKLIWKDVWESETTFEKTVKWYKAYYEEDKRVLTQSYIADAKYRLDSIMKIILLD